MQIETDETNNIRAVPVMLRAPDLVVSDITVPIEVFSGQRMDISWRLTNQGDAAATGTWIDRVYLSNDMAAGGDPAIGYGRERAGAVPPVVSGADPHHDLADCTHPHDANRFTGELHAFV